MQTKHVVLVAAGIGVLLLFSPGVQSADEPGVEVGKLLKTLDDAFQKGDVAALRNLMTDDKIAITPYYDGPQNKEQQIATLTDLKLTEYTRGPMKSTVVSKDVLLITHPLTQKGTFKGRELPAKAHVSSLWVNRDGKWKEALYQETAAGK